MRNILLSTVAMAVLAACADPLADVERISDVDVVGQTPNRDARASDEEIQHDGGVLSGLLRRQPAAQTDPVIAASDAAQASLQDELTGTDDNASVPTVQGTETAEAVTEPVPERRGLFASLRRAAEKRAARETNAAELPVEPDANVEDTDTDTVAAQSASEPLENEPTDSDTAVDVASLDTGIVTETAVPRERRGILGGIFARRSQPQTREDPSVIGETEAEEPEDIALVPAVEDTEDKPGQADPELAVPLKVEEPKRRGLFGGLFAGEAREDPSDTPTDTQVASLEPDAGVAATSSLVEPEKRQGLFARRADKTPRAKPRTGPDSEDVFFGDTLPFGTIARVCNAKNEKLGRRVEKFGRSRSYALYDSKPDSTQPRTFYVTGFADGCPRQFTAALALFGAPSMHEQLRYGRPSEKYPYSTTDKAYEKVKSAICGVSRRKPCGSGIKQLEKNTVFISTYEKFEDNGRWADILVHDGVVLAAALKDP